MSTCFLVNAISVTLMVGALVLLEKDKLLPSPPVVRARRQVREGLGYMWRTPTLRACLLVMVVVGLFALNNQVLLPIIAKKAFGAGAGEYTVMVSCMGLGALFGSIVIARRKAISGQFFLGCGLLFGVVMTIAGFMPNVASFLPLLVLCGGFQTVMLGSGQVLLQLTTEPSMRGRVMAVWMMGLVGTTPFGGPLLGGIAGLGHPLLVYALGGIVTIIAFTCAFSALRRIAVVTRKQVKEESPAEMIDAEAAEEAAAAGSGKTLSSVSPSGCRWLDQPTGIPPDHAGLKNGSVRPGSISEKVTSTGIPALRDSGSASTMLVTMRRSGCSSSSTVAYT